MRIFKWFSGLALVIVLAAGGLLVNVWYFKPVVIDWFYDRVFAKFALGHPEMLSEMRILPPWLDFYGDKLDDASPEQDRREAGDAREALATLRRYDRAALTGEGRLSYDTLEYFLRIKVDGEKYLQHDFPANQLKGVQIALPNFMVQVHQVTSLGEANAYVQRLKKFPLKFDQLLESLKLRETRNIIPPQFVVEEVLAQMRSFAGTPPKQNALFVSFKDKLDKIAIGEIDAATREQLLARVAEAIEGDVYPSYQRLIVYFAALRPKAQGNYGAWHLPDGDAYYAWCVRQHTTSDITPQEVHDLGVAEVARVTVEIDDILKGRGLTDGTIGERMQRLAHDPRQLYPDTAEGKQALLSRYQAILDEVNEGLGDAFDVRPKLGVVVKAVPEASQAGEPIAYYNAGAIDGSRPGVFYANLRDISAMPRFEMRTFAYHEGIPGHHFQISIARELKDVPMFRRVVPFTAYVEGWALYAERLAWELGFEKDPLDNLGRLRWDMLRAVRLVVDSGIHYKHWTREQAIQYMKDQTGKDDAFATAEIERYFVIPGQALAYETGMMKILSLREAARQALGPKFRLAQFHNEVLTHGALPLVLLERVIRDWIARS